MHGQKPPGFTPDWANYVGNSAYTNGLTGKYRGETTNVDTFVPNAFGLYDMHGNVWEWCQDHWHDTYDNAPTHTMAWIDNNNNDYRVLRGGSWNYLPGSCRSASRNHGFALGTYNYIGFRVACSAPRTL